MHLFRSKRGGQSAAAKREMSTLHRENTNRLAVIMKCNSYHSCRTRAPANDYSRRRKHSRRSARYCNDRIHPNALKQWYAIGTPAGEYLAILSYNMRLMAKSENWHSQRYRAVLCPLFPARYRSDSVDCATLRIGCHDHLRVKLQVQFSLPRTSLKRRTHITQRRTTLWAKCVGHIK